jgi:hypothetical protein
MNALEIDVKEIVAEELAKYPNEFRDMDDKYSDYVFDYLSDRISGLPDGWQKLEFNRLLNLLVL